MKKYSVLLHTAYGDDVCSTYYGWVSAMSPGHAVRMCQIDCYLADYENGIVDDKWFVPFHPNDSEKLLVIKGYHYGLGVDQ